MVRRVAVLVRLLLLAACRPSEGTTDAASAVPEPSSAPPPPAARSATSAGPDAATRPVPPLASVSKLTLEQMQGGPSNLRCKGVVFRIVLDLKKNEWTQGTCLAENAIDKSTAPLTMRQGKLSSQQRVPIDVAYEPMTLATSTTCGHDGGALTLRIETGPGHEETYVDENWGCRKPPPEIAHGVKRFAMVFLSVLRGDALGP